MMWSISETSDVKRLKEACVRSRVWYERKTSDNTRNHNNSIHGPGCSHKHQVQGYALCESVFLAGFSLKLISTEY